MDAGQGALPWCWTFSPQSVPVLQILSLYYIIKVAAHVTDMWMGVTLCPQDLRSWMQIWGLWVYHEILFLFAWPSFFQLLKNVEKHLSSWSVSKKLRVFCTHQAMSSHHLALQNGRWSAPCLELLFCLGILCVALHFVPSVKSFCELGLLREHWGRSTCCGVTCRSLVLAEGFEERRKDFHLSPYFPEQGSLSPGALVFALLSCGVWSQVPWLSVMFLGVWWSGEWRWELSFAWS